MQKKLILKSGEQLPDPFEINEKEWMDLSQNMETLPDISSRDITEHLKDKFVYKRIS